MQTATCCLGVTPPMVRGCLTCLTVGASIYATICPLACLVQMAAHTLAEYIAFLATRTVNDIPARIQGETLPGYCFRSSIASTDGTIVIYAGLDPNSCTSTVAALMLWLCGREWHVSDIPLDERRDFTHLAAALADVTRHLLVFYTPHHRFAILCADSKACVLHSNQDSFTEGARTFSLWEHFEHITYMDLAELHAFLAQLQTAPTTPGVLGCLLGKHFEHFKQGHPRDYWFAMLPLLPLQAPV